MTEDPSLQPRQDDGTSGSRPPGWTVNQWAFCRVQDFFHPNPREILANLTPDLLVRGKIVSFTDAGKRECAFAVLAVEGVPEPVIVPVAKLRPGPPNT